MKSGIFITTLFFFLPFSNLFAHPEDTACASLCKRSWWEKATPSAVEKFLNGRDPSKLPGHGQDHALYSAAGFGKPAAIKVLLEKGAHKLVNTSFFGWTPLSTAVVHQRENAPEVIQLLYSYGANPHSTPFGIVVDSRKGLQKGRNLWSFLIIGSSRKPESIKIKVVDALLAIGVDPRSPSPGNGANGLGIASRQSSWGLLKRMIASSSGFKWSEICGLPQNKRTSKTTCAHYAMENHDPEIVRQALNAIEKEGFSINKFPRTVKKETLLHQASLWGSAETMKMLIRKGADIKAKNEQGWTPGKNLQWRIRTGKGRKFSQDEELLRMMDLPLPWTLRVKKFFQELWFFFLDLFK